MQNLKILIGDNDNFFLENLSVALNQMGYYVVGTDTSGTNLLRKIRNINPDVVIADVGLKGMGGFEISDIVEGEGICPCIISFKSNPSEYALKLEKKLVYSYIQKPFNTNTATYVIDNAYYSFKRLMDMEKRLQERKLVDKAKGLLMKRFGFTEDRAYEYLKKKSMDKGMPMAKIAKSVVEIIEKKNQGDI